MDRNLDNRPLRLEYLSDPNAHGFKEATGLNRLISHNLGCAHSAPAALLWISG